MDVDENPFHKNCVPTAAISNNAFAISVIELFFLKHLESLEHELGTTTGSYPTIEGANRELAQHSVVEYILNSNLIA
ncbi:hypothetical protein KIN20_005202 [Parelaphostrongylus tenuis]|uniref:Uncharacterized protein n=1 Tax=Parelaphostrongylus tenuis TaxID=148309 RepID=A0AAD5LZQ4_PARTN|nr:hypothetical protein KIN20_005202 [Parelaphostrongylus tenuis]